MTNDAIKMTKLELNYYEYEFNCMNAVDLSLEAIL